MTSTSARLGYARRVAGVAISNPTEFADRVRGRIERRQARGTETPPLFTDPQGWGGALHRLLGLPEDCDQCCRVPEIWDELTTTLPKNGPSLGEGHDAGVGLAQASYIAVRHLKPHRVVETGVARGITTRFVLEAMRDNDQGHLFSVDLPPLHSAWHDQTAIAVPTALRVRWTFVRGSTRRVLPTLLSEPVGVFIQDSGHTQSLMRWELETAWPRVSPGGLLLSDGANRSGAFREVGDSKDATWLVAHEWGRERYLGALKRPHLTLTEA